MRWLPIRPNISWPRDAQHDLMVRALYGRLHGHIAIEAELLNGTRVKGTARAAKLISASTNRQALH
jgi:hypothetical protein